MLDMLKKLDKIIEDPFDSNGLIVCRIQTSGRREIQGSQEKREETGEGRFIRQESLTISAKNLQDPIRSCKILAKPGRDLQVFSVL
ncbi:MAG: hypothetical protein V8R14_06865 [Clostridia bacterium]